MLIASLLAMWAVRETMRLTIENEAKSLLREEVLELELAIKQLHPDQERIEDEFKRKVLGHSLHGWFASLVAGDSELVWQSDNFPLEELAPSASFDSSAIDSFRRTTDHLVIRHQFEMPDHSKRVILIGEPTEFIKNDVWQLTKIMLGIGAAMLVVAPVSGYLLSSRAISPVSQIISSTRALKPQRLASRLPIRGTGDELDQISAEINSFVSQIARYVESQREFVANAAHELRSPITAIQTSIDVTLDRPRSIAEYQAELETVSEQCQQLRHLVNQLLELAETDANIGPAVSNPVELTALVEKSVQVFTGVAEEHGVRFTLQLQQPAIVAGNAIKLRQVINNLLDNALKFSPAGSEVLVELAPSSDRWRLTIRDSGPGVPAEMLEYIFDRFFQVDPARQRDERRGNGLGLSICRSIVELHGGTIQASNGTGGGLAVTVSLPRIAQ